MPASADCVTAALPKDDCSVRAAGGCDAGPGETATVRLRFTNTELISQGQAPFADFDDLFAERQREADEFYAGIIPEDVSADTKNVMRQAFGGLLWSKQFYHYVVNDWLKGDTAQPAPL